MSFALDGPVLKGGDFAFNHFWNKKIGDRVVLCTENGDWTDLTPEDYAEVARGEVYPGTKLFEILESHGIIATKKNIGSIISDTRKRFGYLASGVSLHIIAVTLRCNHACIYCHAKAHPLNASGKDMDEKTAIAATDFAFQTPSKEFIIEFQGGEPLANFGAIQTIISRAKELSKKTGKKAKFNLVSNLSLLDDEKLAYLIENKVGICTSFDGPKEVHDYNRKLTGGSSYDLVTKWIRAIRDDYKYDVHALPTVTRKTLSFGKELVDEYVEFGFGQVRARGLNNAGIARSAWDKIGYSPEEYLSFWKGVAEYCLKLNREGKSGIREGLLTLIAQKITSKNNIAYTCFGAPCGAALMQAAYDHEGNIYACDEARSFEEFRIGNFKTQKYSEVFASKQALDFVDLSSGLKTMCDACAWHPYCGPCMVCTYGAQGNIVPKLALDHECAVRKGMIGFVFEKLVANGPEKKIIEKWVDAETPPIQK